MTIEFAMAVKGSSADVAQATGPAETDDAAGATETQTTELAQGPGPTIGSGPTGAGPTEASEEVVVERQKALSQMVDLVSQSLDNALSPSIFALSAADLLGHFKHLALCIVQGFAFQFEAFALYFLEGVGVREACSICNFSSS